MIDSVKVERPAGSYYVMTVMGRGFGDRRGDLKVFSPDNLELNVPHLSIPHLNVMRWSDTEIVAEVADGELMPGALLPGEWVAVVLPAPGIVASFEVPDPNAPNEGVPDPAHTADYDTLVAHAESMGVKVDKRWGEERLRQEIEAAEPEG